MGLFAKLGPWERLLSGLRRRVKAIQAVDDAALQ